MSARDYYDVLGVSKSATADDIRKAYRKLARQLHPDVNKASDAQKKFTEVQHAYDVLSDDQKRKIYDQYGPGAVEGGAAPPPGAGRGGRSAWPHAGPGVRGAPDFDSEELSEMFESIFGRSSPFSAKTARGRGSRQRGHAPEEETHHEVTVGFETAARGGTETLRIEHDGRARTLEVKIPAGIDDGAQLRVRGGGAKSHAPDMILTIRTGAHPLWRRGEFSETGKGLDLYLDLPLTVAEATLGAAVTIPTLAGPVELSVPQGSASGRKLRLRGRGIRDEQGRQGDLYAVVRIVPPPGPFSEPERDALRAMDARTPPPRDTREWSGG
ncbi:Curved DNA-binding protein [Phycisphaerales bacterium]|nr:Curved DNA-binding protein [Phycisphaerales bacterium]